MRGALLTATACLLVGGGAEATRAETPVEPPPPPPVQPAPPAEEPKKEAPPKEEPKKPEPSKDENDELDKLLDEATGSKALGGWAGDKLAPKPTYPYLEHHGYFRFRADLFYNGHLGTVVPGVADSGTSAIPAPLTENEVNNGLNPFGGSVSSDDNKVIANANLRFRYSPTIHIADTLRIKATFDFLDNLVLGSTPDFAGNANRPDVPLVAFSAAQASPSSGINGFWDAVRIKEAYAEWQPAFVLRAGRMRSHFGLGILANGGHEHDADYGDYTDRVMLLLKVFGIYAAVAWDFPYQGAITDDPGDQFGQPKDIGEMDDVIQLVFTLFQRPLSAEETEKRKVNLWEKHEPTFDWGFYGVYRQQDMDLSAGAFDAWRTDGGEKAYDALDLVPRQAWAVIPDLWFKYEQRFNYYSGLRIELEACAIIGEVANVSDIPGVATPDRQILQFGGAFELEADYESWKFGFDTGFATGDSAEGFGVNDRNTLAEPDGTPNREVTAYKFDRDYHIDMMLFREVIGTVTNAYYVKPFLQYDLFDQPEESLGARVDLLIATALEPQATPGNDPFYGFEADLRIFYEEVGVFNLDLEWGFLVPGAAFNYRPVGQPQNNRDAEFGFTVQGRMTLLF
jgi:uncharacterized protein (TIGR04551 family)